MRSTTSFLFTLSIAAVAGCGGAKTSAPPVTEPAKAPIATSERPRPPRPPPNCKRGRKAASEAASDGATDGPVTDADLVVASLRGQFRECYRNGLQIDPELDGCVVLEAKVGPDGSVSSSDAVVTDRLSPEVIACLSGVVRNARFSATGAAGSKLNIPITFLQQPTSPLPKNPPTSPPGPQPTGALPGEIAGFRFGMTPAEFADHCGAVGTPNPLVGKDPELRLHTCDGVEVEPGMRLNMFLGFCDGDSRLCEIDYWTDRNAAKAFVLLNAKLTERYGTAPSDTSTLREDSIATCSQGDGKIRRTWWWGTPSDIKGRVLLAFECRGGKQSVGVYYDDPLGAKQQVKRAKHDGTWPF